MIKKNLIRVFYFYRDGFREMTWGRVLWAIILIKLFVMFFVLKLFFFGLAAEAFDLANVVPPFSGGGSQNTRF